MARLKSLVADAFKPISDLKTNRYQFKGPAGIDEETLPSGLSRVSCMGFIGIAFIDVESKAILNMFSLEPGKRHIIRRSNDVRVVVECEPDVVWFVEYSNRFNKSDPNRVEAALLRPRSQKEEIQDYLNEMAARALGSEYADGLRKGTHEIDMENDDYSEHLEDDEHAPLSVHQMKLIIGEMEKELKEEIARMENRDIEEEAPVFPLKTGETLSKSSKKGAPAPSKDSELPDDGTP